MKFSTLTRHTREGFKSIWRNGWMSFASITSIFISLLILGVFILLAFNMNAMAAQIESQVQIRVYLETDASDEMIAEVQRKIGNIEQVSKLTYISKEEGLEILRERMGEENGNWLEGYNSENNPLPVTFTIDVRDPKLVKDVADQIKTIAASYETSPIAEVKYGQGTVETLFKITNAIRTAGYIVVAVLSITAILLISNTIRMTIVARQREIGIMKMVGATNAFIRWPFFIEGALIGVITSTVTTALVLFGYDRIIKAFQYDLSFMMFQLQPVKEVMPLTSLMMILLGSFIGIWGSVVSVRKYLKV